MATAPTAPLNLYYSVDSAQAAQIKYAQEAWITRAATATAIACATLAALANIYLIAAAAPFTLVCFNYSLYSLAKETLAPYLKNQFTHADRLKAQGDREAKIHSQWERLQAMDPSALNEVFHKYALPASPHENITPAARSRLLARISYWDELCSQLIPVSDSLYEQKNFQEAVKAGAATMKAKIKAAFYIALFSHPEHPGKFKDSFAWVDMSFEERWIRSNSNIGSDDALVQTRDTPPKTIIGLTDFDSETSALAKILIPPSGSGQ